MSFEIKYDNEGQPIRNQQPPIQQIESPEVEQTQHLEAVEQPLEQSAAAEEHDHVHDDSAAAVEEVEQPVAPQRDNIRELRLAKQRAEYERDELIRILRETQQPKQQAAPEEDYNVTIGDDELAEGKHLQKMGRKLKKLEQELETTRKQTKESLVQAQIQAQYPDYYRVVNEDTLTAFRENFPELASTIRSSSDLYSQAVSAYTLIKKFGIYQDPQVTQEREAAKKNLAKPRPLASVSPQTGSNPLSQANAFANGLTEDLKKSLLKEMHDSRRGY